MRNLALVLVAAFFAAWAPAQSSPCTTNLVTDGGFSSILPTWAVVDLSASFDTTTDVTGVGADRSLRVSSNGFPNPSINTITPLTLVPSTTYEISIDLLWDNGSGSNLDVGLTIGGLRTRICYFTYNSGVQERTRLSSLFTVASPGSYVLDIQPSMAAQEFLNIDNVRVHPAVLPVFTFDQHGRRDGALNSYLIQADPNNFVAVCWALGQQSPHLAVPVCTGTVQIGPVPSVWIALDLTSANGLGVKAGNFDIPAGVAQFRIYWQAVRFDMNSACHIGCGDMIAF